MYARVSVQHTCWMSFTLTRLSVSLPPSLPLSSSLLLRKSDVRIEAMRRDRVTAVLIKSAINKTLDHIMHAQFTASNDFGNLYN